MTTPEPTQGAPQASTSIPHSTNPVNDFVDADDYLSSFGGNDFPDTPLDAKTGAPNFSGAFTTSTPTVEKEPLSDRESIENTETLMDIREGVQAYSLSLVVDGNFNRVDDFMYEPRAKQKLVQAWSKVIGKYRIRVSPLAAVFWAEATNTTPLIMEAMRQRKYRLEAELAKAKLRQYEQQQPEGRTVYSRNDTKTQWKVDENGYFEYTESNTYIPKKSRKMKPELSQENYELLCKHNGKEYVDEVFKITAQ